MEDGFENGFHVILVNVLFYCIHGGLDSDGWFFVNCLFFLSFWPLGILGGALSLFFLLDIGNVLDYSSRRSSMK